MIQYFGLNFWFNGVKNWTSMCIRTQVVRIEWEQADHWIKIMEFLISCYGVPNFGKKLVVRQYLESLF